jgi:hypothetical protein
MGVHIVSPPTKIVADGYSGDLNTVESQGEVAEKLGSPSQPEVVILEPQQICQPYSRAHQNCGRPVLHSGGFR